MPYLDLTRTFGPDMPVYPGDPQPKLERIAEIAAQGYTDHKLDSGLHVGTHVDAPLHMVADGKLLSDIPVERFFGRGVLLDARGKVFIDVDVLADVTLQPGDIVLVHTGWDSRWGEENYFSEYPHLTKALAQKFVEAKVHLVGLDSPSPDYTPYPIHKLLLGHDILIVENLVGLQQLVGVQKFDVIALPAKLQADAAPVRVLAKV